MRIKYHCELLLCYLLLQVENDIYYKVYISSSFVSSITVNIKCTYCSYRNLYLKLVEWDCRGRVERQSNGHDIHESRFCLPETKNSKLRLLDF